MSKRTFVAFRASLASKVSWTRRPRRKFHRYTQLWVIDSYVVKLAILRQNHWLIIPPTLSFTTWALRFLLMHL